MRAVGYTKDTPDPPAGEIVRDSRGNPTKVVTSVNGSEFSDFWLSAVTRSEKPNL